MKTFKEISFQEAKEIFSEFTETLEKDRYQIIREIEKSKRNKFYEIPSLEVIYARNVGYMGRWAQLAKGKLCIKAYLIRTDGQISNPELFFSVVARNKETNRINSFDFSEAVFLIDD